MDTKIIFLKNFFTILIIVTIGVYYSCSRQEVSVNKIRLAYIQNDLHHLPAFVALEKGYYNKDNIRVEIAGIFKAGPEEMSAFASHSIDVGYVGEAPLITSQANNMVSVKMIAQVNKGGSALVVARNSQVQNIIDLKGRIVAIPGHATIQDILLRKLLEEHGIKPTELTIMVLKPPEMLNTLKSGEIDAFIAWEPYPSKALTSGIGKIILDSDAIWKEHPCCALIVNSEFMKNRVLIKAFIKAHLQAYRFIRDNPHEAIKIGAKYTGMDEITVAEALKRIKFDPIPSLEDKKEFVEILRRLGYISIRNPKGFINSIMDLNLLSEVEVNEKIIH